jgi:histidine kinase
MAHEINQPLVIISLSVGNILHKLDSGQRLSKEYLEEKFGTMMHNIHRIRQIIDDIRTFARDEGGILIEQVDIRAIVTNVLDDRRDRFRAEGIRLVTRIGHGDLLVAGNPYKLEQVLTNLVTNAYDAVMEKETLPDGPAVDRTIEVKASRKQHTIYLTVSDNGTGITPENRQRLFTPFFTTKAEGVGTGLGLPIAYGIVTDMGGEITVSSTPGKGSTFVVSLPAV